MNLKPPDRRAARAGDRRPFVTEIKALLRRGAAPGATTYP